MASPRTSDTLIVGAGPAGCVLANRLTEDAGRAVALLEAGPDYGAEPGAWPAAFRDPINIAPPLHLWGYVHGGRPAERELALHRARVVGGTTTINACLWLRGSAADYDEWVALGNPGWSFADLLPFFRRAECDPVGGPLHGDDGPVPVSRADEAALSPVDRAFRDAAQAVGLPVVADFNGEPAQSPGVGPTPKNVAAGVRMNAAFTYLAPARGRPNLTIVPDVLVDRVLVENGRATGVRAADGREFRAREVVLCAGAFGSPAILQRSGIGPANELRRFGIPLVVDLPGIGASLFDHPLVNGLMECAIAPGNDPAAPTFAPLMIKARGRQTGEEIDLHVYQGQSFDGERGAWTFWLSVSLQPARSRGRVRLTSADPAATLEIDHAYFSDPSDLEILCDGVEFVNELIAAPPLAHLVTPLSGRALRWRGRDELRAKVRTNVATTFHPSGTCRMGPETDPAAVVDHEGRVRGVAGLRVVDAAIFPTIPRANLHCTIVAAAEKFAETMRHA
jgi:choline dehydrogenase